MIGGTAAFLLIWVGQLVSLVGSSLTSFALGVWAYQAAPENGATAYALVVLATMGPNALLSLLVGPLVDRWDRRNVMLLSDAGSGLCTLAILALLLTGQLALWPILLATALSSAFSALQWPAYAAATTLLIPKQHYGRANGLVQLAQGIATIASPAIAGALIETIGVQGIIAIDLSTFGCAVLTLLLVRVPRPAASLEESEQSFAAQLGYGLRYITARPGLLGLLALYACLNFLFAFVMALFGPLVLSFADEQALGNVTTIGASGMIVGGGLMAVWGGPRHRIHGVLVFLMLAGVAIAASGLSPSLGLIAAAAFGFFFCYPLIAASSNAIWQSKVEASVQGRVFGTRSTIATFSLVPGYALAGPLADGVFEPALSAHGALAESVGRVIGTGPGRGIGLMLIIAGVLTTLISTCGYLVPRIRHLERDLPDAGEPPVQEVKPGDP